MELRNKRIIVLSVLSIVTYIVENFLPYPIIFLRIGVGNAFIVATFYLVDIKGAAVVLFMKLVVGSIISGRFLTPFFLFSLSGSLFSFLAMSLFFRITTFFSPVGISTIGAVFHNIGQMIVLFFYYGIGIIEKWFMFLWYFGILSGIITGIIALYIIRSDIERWLQKRISTTY